MTTKEWSIGKKVNDVTVVRNMPIELYHADDSVSSSELADFKENPLLWWYRKYERLERKKTTSAMAFGTLLHTMLELGVQASCVTVPEEFLNKDGGIIGNSKDYKAWKADHEGKLIIKEGEPNPFQFISEHLAECDKAQPFLDTPQSELSLFWEEFGGLNLRARIDSIAKHGVIGDYKTTRNIEPYAFRKDMAKMHYPERLALYQRGVEKMTGDILPVVCIAIENTAPWRVRCYEIDEYWLAKCRDELPIQLERMKNFDPSEVLNQPIEVLTEVSYAEYATENDEDEDDDDWN